MFGAEWGKLGAKSGQMESGDLLVELLGEHVDLADLVLIVRSVLPEFDLGEHLVGEGA